MNEVVDQEAVVPAPKSAWAGVTQGVLMALMVIGIAVALLRGAPEAEKPGPEKPPGIDVRWIADDETDPEGPGLHNMRVQGGWIVFSRSWGCFVPEPRPVRSVAPVVSGS